MIQFSDGEMIYGTTRDISLDGVFVDCVLTQKQHARGLRLGEFGVFVLRYRCGARDEALRLRAQLVHMLPSGVGLTIQFAELSKADQRVLSRIVASGDIDLGDDRR